MAGRGAPRRASRLAGDGRLAAARRRAPQRRRPHPARASTRALAPAAAEPAARRTAGTAGRRAAAARAVLPPGAQRGVPGRADAPLGRRAHHRAGRGGVPGPDGDHGAADQPRQGDAARSTVPASSRPRRTSSPSGCTPSARCSTWRSTRGTPRRPATRPHRRRPGGARRSGWPGCSARAEAAGRRPDDETTGLLALMLLTHARRDARTDARGDLVPLAEQDRSRWDADQVAEGTGLVAAVLARGRGRPVPAAGGDRGGPRGGRRVRRHRLAADHVALPAARPDRARAHGDPQPRGRRRDGARTRRRASAVLAPARRRTRRSPRSHRLPAVRAHLRELAGRRAGCPRRLPRGRPADRGAVPEQRYLAHRAARGCAGATTIGQVRPEPERSARLAQRPHRPTRRLDDGMDRLRR